MPEIKEYTPRVEASGPTAVQRAVPNNYGASVGEAMGKFGETVAQASNQMQDTFEKRREQQDLSDLDASVSTAHAQLGVEYQKELRDGTLNTEDFKQKVDATLEQVQGGVNTRAGQQRFQQVKAATSGYFLQEAMKGQAQLAGEKAVSNVKTALENRTAELLQKPDKFEFNLNLHNQAVDDSVRSGLLPATKADELKRLGAQDLAENAVRGWAALDPEAAKQKLNAGDFDKYLGGDTKHRLDGEIRQAENAKRVEEERIQKQLKEAREKRQEAANEKHLQALYDNGLSTSDVLKDKDLDFAAKEHLLKMVEARQNDRVQSDNATTRMIMADILLPESDPNRKIKNQEDINQYYISHQINKEDLQWLRGEFIGKGTVEGENERVLKKALIDTATNNILKPDKMTGLADPIASQNFSAWQYETINKIQKAKANGTFTMDMYNPKSDKYLGNNMGQYQRNMTDIIKDNAAKLRRKSSAPPNTTLMELPDGSKAYIPNDKVDAAISRKAKKVVQ